MVDTTATGLPHLHQALSETYSGVRGATARAAWYELGWRWLALLAVPFTIDLLFAMPVWMRWASLVGMVAYLLWGISRLTSKRTRPRMSEEWAARVVESQHPELDNALINAVQFARRLEAVSSEQDLMRREMQRGENAATALTTDSAIDRLPERRALRLFTLAIVGWVMLTVVFPGGVFAVFPRLFAPWLDDITPPFSLTRFEVRPAGASVRYGESLNVAVTINGPIPDNLSLMTKTGATGWRGLSLDAGEPGKYSLTLADLRDDTWFFVQGRGSRSARYKITVVRPPVVKSVKATYTYPKYTKKEPSTQAVGEEGLHALIHTQVSLEITANRPLSGGELMIQNATGDAQHIAITPSPRDTTQGLVKMEVLRPGTYHVLLQAEDGQQTPEAAKGKITVEQDGTPAVWIEYPGQDLIVTPDMKVPILVESEDDNAVQSMEIHRVVNELGDSPRKLSVPVPLPKVQDRLVMDLPDLGVRPGDTITYYATAFDNQPGHPNMGETLPFTIKVVTQEEYDAALKKQRETADLTQETKDIVSAVKDLAERQEQVAKDLEQLQRQAAKNPGDKSAAAKLEQARKEQKALQEEARSLSEKLKDYAQSPSATEVEKALKRKIAEMAQAMAEAANGPMQSAQTGSPADAAESARDAAKRLAQVDKKMGEQIQKAIEHIEKILPLYMDLERFKALTDEQGQLVLKARQYQLQEKTSGADRAKLEQLASQQNRIQEELKRVQADLRQHAADAQTNFPKAAATALKIANEISTRQIPNLMQEGKDKLRQWDGPNAFQSAQAALRQMQAMIAECNGGQGGDCQGELDINLSRALGQSGLGSSLPGLAAGLGMGNGGSGGMGFGMGGMQMGSGGQRGGGSAMRGPKPYMASFQSSSGSGGSKKERHQNRVAGQPAALSPADVEVIKTNATKPPKVAADDSGRYPVEYKKLVSKYFESVAEGK